MSKGKMKMKAKPKMLKGALKQADGPIGMPLGGKKSKAARDKRLEKEPM